MFFSWRILNVKGKCLFVLICVILITLPLTISFARTVHYIITTDDITWTPHNLKHCPDVESGYDVSTNKLIIKKHIWFCGQKNIPTQTMIVSKTIDNILPEMEDTDTVVYNIDIAYLPDDWQLIANTPGGSL